ncbi:2-amino-3,7-dideoxy-D-threo-hept-6-ulosonate synthase [Paraburkholderia aspalathi]|uniref:2-amino-3,7-dideoxy-D-threo-hept-6-ulosonate synthase n=1 Tax=Paraburkholderia aspalathi TaxID=1324617 RepID=UPI0038BBE609
MGKRTRLSRLFHAESNRSFIVPMDHGATLGPIPGIVDAARAMDWVGGVGGEAIQGVVLHRGAIERCASHESAHRVPTRILHLSASTAISPNPNAKTLVASVEDALQFGADAVSVHVNLGSETEAVMLRDLGVVASRCQRWGMPLLAMVYARAGGKTSAHYQDVKLAARLAAEMGADIVKVTYPGSAEAMNEVVEGCFVPILIAGGDKDEGSCTVDMVRDAIAGGASGICIGRNLFQAARPGALASDLAQIVHGVVVRRDLVSLPSPAFGAT